MYLEIFFFIIGLVLLIFGADWLVDGASALAKKYHISDLAIGLTIVSFGTSAPELVVNTFASVKGSQDLVFGNVIGSNFFNLFAILGIAGLITPLAVQSSTVWKEIPISLLAIVVLFFLANDQLFFSNNPLLSRLDGILLFAFFIAFLYYVHKQLKVEPDISIHIKKHSTLVIWLLIIGGLAGLVIGGQMVVINAISVAAKMGISEHIIGLTIVAVGTSLPELATSVVAAMKKNVDIAVGNIVGSNIFNIFFILSVSALVRPIAFSPTFNIDLYLVAGGTLFLFIAMFTGKKHKLDRWEAFVLLSIYIAYMVYIVLNAA